MTCSHKNESFHRFCTTCGSKLERHICSCGAANLTTAEFCGVCGSDLNQALGGQAHTAGTMARLKITEFTEQRDEKQDAQKQSSSAVTQDDIDQLFKK